MPAADPRFSSDGGPASRGAFPAGGSSNDRDGPGGSSGGGEGERDRATFECNICLDTARDAVISMCGHLFWYEARHRLMVEWVEVEVVVLEPLARRRLEFSRVRGLVSPSVLGGFMLLYDGFVRVK